MAFCRLLLPFLVICIASTYGKVPVYIWGDLETSIKSNPLSSVTEKEFEDILQEELKKDTFTVIFVEETLSAEDFSHKNSEGESSFPYLQRTSSLRQAAYLPGVENAVAALTDVVDPEKVDRMTVNNNGITDQIVPQNGRILFVTFEDAAEDENRADMLQRHDNIMRDIMGNIGEDGYIAVYTGRNPSWTVPESHGRIRRQAERSHIQNVTLNGLKMYVNRVVVTVDGMVTNVTEVDSTDSVINGTEMSTTMMSGDNSLTLNFLKKAGYWFFSSVIYKQGDHESVLMPETEVFAQDGFAYRCGQNVTFSNRINQTVIVNFQDLKVQPYFRENSSDTLMYGDSINCVGFFTVPIWSGLFVTFILLAITFYGIMMMMDIRTMDRFDDPKGKTISINAE